MGRRGGLALAVLLGVSRVAATAEQVVDYLYIEANEGSSSGGHAALRLGDAVFHFQREEPGILRLTRAPAGAFERQYRVLQNRTIHVSRVPVSDETFALVRDGFARRQLAQTQQLDCLESLRADVRLLDAMLARRRGAGGDIRLAGPGFFFADAGGPTPAAEEPALVALRAQVERVHGPEFLARRAGALRAALARLAPDTTAMPPPPVQDTPLAPCYGFAQRHEDLAVALLAVEALRTARPLVTDGLVGPTSIPLALREAEPALVEVIAATLAPRLVELVASTRPGAGYALVVGMARLAALERTRRTGHWVLLDAFPPEAPALAPVRVARRRAAFTELATVARRELEQARRALARRASATAGVPELDLGAFEAAASRLHEIEAALDAGRPLRIAPGPMVPARAVRITALESVHPDAALADARDVAHARAQWYGDAVEHLYPYRLTSRNCITELLRTVDDTLTGPGAREPSARRVEWEQRLGGAVDPDGALTFVPFVAARAVAAALGGARTFALPSYRRERLDRLVAQNAPLRVRLREASPLTSAIYRHNPDDSAFALFTDDAVATRPLFGLVNLATGLGAGAVGLVTWPVDRGDTLRAGVRGALFSLPELAFCNIRKGSFAAPPE